MSIPLDRLYHYIESVAQDVYGDTVIYRFYPHGSKKLTDLNYLNPTNWPWSALVPHIYCYDQEPLDYEYYQNYTMEDIKSDPVASVFKNTNIVLPWHNLRIRYWDIFDRCVLLHSEKRSKNLNQYQNNNFIPVYYWSHGIIARDWFRYAEHLSQHKSVKKHFLIYNRAWTGTREYRLKFADMLIDHQLVDQCQTSIGFTDQGVHYLDHTFINPVWQPMHNLEHSFNRNFTTSCYSADFDITDYESTDIEIVLETLFDDDRLQLTEKSLRPIALGQPFILAGTYGSLDYLKSYGFKTFSSVFNEDYDSIVDPLKRLTAIIELMKTISNWTNEQRTKNMHQLKLIADYNRQHFFSNNFFNQLTSELKNNLDKGLKELVQTNTSQRYFNLRKLMAHDPILHAHMTGLTEFPTRADIAKVVQIAQSYRNKY